MAASCGGGKLLDILQILEEHKFEVDQWENNDFRINQTNNHQEKQIFTDAVYYCVFLLKENNRMTNEESQTRSARSRALGQEMFEKILSIDIRVEVTTDENSFEYEDQRIEKRELSPDNVGEVNSGLISNELEAKTMETETMEAETIETETIETEKIETETTETETTETETMNVQEEPNVESDGQYLASIEDNRSSSPSTPHASDTDDSTDLPYNKSHGQQFIFQLEVKKRVINLANQNPSWSLGMLQREGSRNVRSFRQLRKWEKQIVRGGTTRDRHDAVNVWTYTRFVEARDNNQHITADRIREWASLAATKYFNADFHFEPNENWINNFIQLFEIRGNAKIGYYKKADKGIPRTWRGRRKKKK